MFYKSTSLPYSVVAYEKIDTSSFRLSLISTNGITILDDTGNIIKEKDIRQLVFTAFSFNGETVAGLSSSGSLYILQVLGEEVLKLPIPVIHEDVVALISLQMPLSCWVIVTCNRIITIYDNTVTVKEYREMYPIDRPLLLAACLLHNNSLLTLDTRGNLVTYCLEEACYCVVSRIRIALPSLSSHAAISSNGEFAYLIDSYGRTATLINLASQTVLQTMTSPRPRAYREDTELLQACFSSDNDTLYVANALGGVQVYRCENAVWKLNNAFDTEYPQLQGEYARPVVNMVALRSGLVYALDDGLYYVHVAG